MNKAIKALSQAKNIYIFGIGASSLPAYDIYHKLNRINKPALFNFDSHMIIEFLNYSTKEDVILLFSYSGNSNEVIYPAEIGIKNESTVISITSDEDSELARNSTITLLLPKTEGVVRSGAITSKINSLIMVDLLYFRLVSPNLEVIEKDLIKTSELTSKFKSRYR